MKDAQGLQFLKHRLVDLGHDGHVDSGQSDSPLQYQLHPDGRRQSYRPGHRRVAEGDAEIDHRRDDLLPTHGRPSRPTRRPPDGRISRSARILGLDVMLEHQHIALPRCVAHPLEHARGENVHGRSPPHRQGLVVEQAEPLEGFHDRGSPVWAERLRDPERHVALYVAHPAGTAPKQLGHESPVGQPLQTVPLLFIQEPEVPDVVHQVAPSRVAERAAEHGPCPSQAVRLQIGKAVAVGVPLELDDPPFDPQRHRPATLEQDLAVYEDLLALLPVEGGVLAGKQDTLGAPRELVAEGVGIGLRRGQAPAPRAEGDDLPTTVPYRVDDPHGGHVVDPRVHAHLVQEDHARVFRRTVQSRHGLLDVGRRHHVRAVLDTRGGHHRVVHERQQAHGYVATPDELIEGTFVGQVHPPRHSLGVISDYLLGLAQGPTRHRHADVGEPQEIPDMRSGDHAGTQNEHVFHTSLLSTKSSR
jgi:hypothetical protein